MTNLLYHLKEPDNVLILMLENSIQISTLEAPWLAFHFAFVLFVMKTILIRN